MLDGQGMTDGAKMHGDDRVATSVPGQFDAASDMAVSPLFWIAAAALVVAMLVGLKLDGPIATMIATGVFLIGGLPHGAFDIALARRAASTQGRVAIIAILSAYMAVAIGMVVLWALAPVAALVLFLVVAAVHFGDDWNILPEPLLRVAAGAAIIAAPAIGHQAAVAAIFEAMTGGAGGRVVAQVALAIAPVALLVTAVGMASAWRDGARAWAAATATAIAVLLVAPPITGFALFFVFLHSPRHLQPTRAALDDWSTARWIGTGAGMSLVAVSGWLVLTRIGPLGVSGDVAANAFQLLAAVAVPHLLLSGWIERRTISRATSGIAR